MKTHLLTLCIVLLAGLIACDNDKKKDNDKKDTLATAVPEKTDAAAETPAAPRDTAAERIAWEKYMTPGEMHQMLADMNGEWTEEITMWMDPAAPPEKSKGTVNYKMLYGGLYQESKFKGNFMGMPFEGTGILGFDNAKKKFVNTWVDNMGTGIMYSEGTWDPATKTIEMKGKMVDPLTGKDCELREIIKIVDKDNHVMEMYITTDGKESKSMEAKINRKKT